VEIHVFVRLMLDKFKMAHFGHIITNLDKSICLPSFYFFRFGLLAARLADFDDGGGGVASIFRNPSSKLTPGNFRFNDLPINYRFT
jgi:hypothetical protein